jgi:hypothetical protein
MKRISNLYEKIYSIENLQLADAIARKGKSKQPGVIEHERNREIVVHHFKLEDSKVKAFQEKGTGKCLHLQISFDNRKHVVFTGSTGLIEVIQKIPETGFPFTTTIVEENDRYLFT